MSEPGAADREILHRQFAARTRQHRPAAPAAVRSPCKMSRRRAMPWRAATSCFQVPSATSTGASARPIMIEDAIMMPPDALSETTRYAPMPSMPDCRT